MVTDEEICEALKSVLRESNPRTFTNLNQLLQVLQSKLGGHDLTHKLDFITHQIHLLFGSQQPQQPPPPPSPPLLPQRQFLHPHQPQQQQQPPHKDHFALYQNPNFQTSPTVVPASSGFLNFSAGTVSPVKHAAAAVAVADASGARGEAHSLPVNSEVPKEGTQPKAKRRGGPGGLNKLCGVSPELQVIVGQPALPRTEIVKQLWAYIRKNNLQDPSNKRKIICNDELRVVFETDCTDMFKMNKLLAKHIITLEPTKQPVPKKQKVEVESGTISGQPAPSVIISDALANFFGIAEREMLQSEVLRRIWEYIKVNQLEDPVNPMTIVCDAKLQELFGCESISALGIPEVLGRHHIVRRS
ncbi:hypothetical protein TanjilG_07743 [Lupinus angustifolius]|uniref:DM2 domain-containing protein n=1 Tax=Lupinus angustifolius TaxID=3871 RepID=A0A1J7GQS5_LUPAN|nr:PREDICTED: uncharacterized protein LOC109334738 isoform X1 [Lupinus angustifolius]XP_019426197.1 PREDICTED: uncharacterized protein LOC109334738 isoform X1 [Lupinus angustifolius]OIV92004.1 hypothetical protein TanjilG_07743 [Lupinus angustifolius]